MGSSHRIDENLFRTLINLVEFHLSPIFLLYFNGYTSDVNLDDVCYWPNNLLPIERPHYYFFTSYTVYLVHLDDTNIDVASVNFLAELKSGQRAIV